MLSIAVHQLKINHRIPGHVLAPRAGAGSLRIKLKIIAAAKGTACTGKNDDVNGVIVVGSTDGIFQQRRHLIIDGI